MKKITLLILSFLITSLSFGQDLVISGIIDASLTGGTPKAIELYVVNDINDLSTYGIGSANNGGGTDGVEFELSGSATAGSYLYIASEEPMFNAFFGFSPDFVNNVANNNGDDAIELFSNVSGGTGTVIDTFGELDVDGSGQDWEYMDGWAYRNSSTGPDGTTFIIGNWTFSGINVLDDETTNDTAATPFPIGTYSTEPPTCALSLSNITTTCDTETTGADTVTVTIDFTNGAIAGLMLATTSGIISGDNPAMVAEGTIIITDVAEATVFDITVTSDDCNISQTITVPECTLIPEVTTIAELRAGTIGEQYTLTGEAILTFQQDFRGQKWIEDDTAAILIDDNGSVITTVYSIGDGITGITGTLAQFGDLIQFVPSEDPGMASSTGNTIVPQEITATMLTTSPVDYESELITIVDEATIDTSENTTWVNGTVYPAATDNGGFNIRTAFFDVDYIGESISSNTVVYTGIVTFNSGAYFITARDTNDIEIITNGCDLILGEISSMCDSETSGQDSTTISIAYTGGATGTTYMLNVTSGTIEGDDPSTVAEGIITITGVSEAATITFTATSDSDICNFSEEITTNSCEPAPEVTSLADLRALDVGSEATLLGEAILTFQRDTRNQKWIEDSTGAILIDDNAGVITTTYEIGDGISGITGTITEFNGLLQFVPSQDPGAATSTGNTVQAQEVTITELTENGEDYESELVQIIQVIVETTDTNWVSSQNYDISNNGDIFTLRTNFFDADYIGTAIPTEETNISGVLGQFDNNDDDVNEGYQIQPRFLADFDEFLSVEDTNVLSVNMYPNPATSTINITTATSGEKAVTIYEVSGKKVIDTVTTQSVDVSTLATGIYLVRIIEANQSITSRLIIE